jgi:hypothetical protein
MLKNDSCTEEPLENLEEEEFFATNDNLIDEGSEKDEEYFQMSPDTWIRNVESFEKNDNDDDDDDEFCTNATVYRRPSNESTVNWLKRMDLWCKDDGFTHSPLAGGGTASIPYAINDIFLKQMSYATRQGFNRGILNINSLNEQHGLNNLGYFKMHYDEDFHEIMPEKRHFQTKQQFKDKCNSLNQSILRRAILQQHDLAEFYSGTVSNRDLKRFLRVYILTAPAKRREKHEITDENDNIDIIQEISIGCHKVWPHIVVSAKIGATIRKYNVQSCESFFDERSSEYLQNSFEDAIDEAVYFRTGLRLPFADKTILCDQCEKGIACTKCGGRKKIEAERPYTISEVLDGPLSFEECTNDLTENEIDVLIEQRLNNEELLRCQESEYYTLKKCTIRVSDDAKLSGGFTMPPKAEIPIECGIQSKKLMKFKSMETFERHRAAAGTSLSQNELKESRIRNRNYVLLEAHDERIDYIKNLIQEAIFSNVTGPIYNEIQISQVWFLRQMRKYKVLVRGKGSQFCHNKGSSHGGNHILFFVNTSGITQCCFSTKTPTNSSIPCCHAIGHMNHEFVYESSVVHLSPENVQFLFPEEILIRQLKEASLRIAEETNKANEETLNGGQRSTETISNLASAADDHRRLYVEQNKLKKQSRERGECADDQRQTKKLKMRKNDCLTIKNICEHAPARTPNQNRSITFSALFNK